MKIEIKIDLTPDTTAELDRIAKSIVNLCESFDLLEKEVDAYSVRIEKIEEMTTRFAPESEED
jgi:hypothetical protein